MVTSRAVLAVLARQDGLITAAQAAQLGLPGRTLRRRVEDDGWRRVAPQVYLPLPTPPAPPAAVPRAGGHRLTERARIRAAGLWAGERGVISGPAAARWHGMLTTALAEVEVTVPRRIGLRSHRGVRIRRRDLAGADCTHRDGLRLTAVPLTALETAIAVPDGSAFLDRALQKHVRFEHVYEAYCRNMGARGFARIAALLTAAADRADSAAERLMLSLLRGAGLTGWQRGRPFERWKIDFAFPAAKLAIEVDGWAYHTDVERFRSDRQKGNALVRAGWKLLRFTWHDLANRPHYVLAEIRAALLTAEATA